MYETATGDSITKSRIGVVLSDGPFDLYVLVTGHASGVKGGRFSEVAQYVVPWLTSEFPAACFDMFGTRSKRLSKEMVRVDLLLKPGRNPRQSDPSCAEMQRKVRQRVWAGAYFGFSKVKDQLPGFFQNMALRCSTVGCNNLMVFAAASRVSGPDSLPADGDAHLRSFLSQADKVIAESHKQMKSVNPRFRNTTVQASQAVADWM